MVAPGLSSQNEGIATSIRNYYKALQLSDSAEVTVVTTQLASEFEYLDEEIISDDNIHFFDISNSFWRYSKSLNIFLKNKMMDYDLVWVHGTWLSHSFFVAKYAKKYNKPYIVTPHGSLTPYALNLKPVKKSIYWFFIEKKVLSAATAIHCVTDMESSDIEKLIKVKRFVVPNAMNEEYILKKEDNPKNQICYIGRFHEKKGLDLLLRAVSEMKNVKLVVAGTGERKYMEYIYELAEKLKLEEKVEFVGFVDKAEKKHIFSTSVFTVIPSYSDILTLVALESIMHSTPVLLTEACGFDDIDKYNAGMIMPDNNVKTIQNYIGKMLKMDINKMSENAYSLAIEKYSIEAISKNLLSHLEETHLNYKK